MKGFARLLILSHAQSLIPQAHVPGLLWNVMTGQTGEARRSVHELQHFRFSVVLDDLMGITSCSGAALM